LAKLCIASGDLVAAKDLLDKVGKSHWDCLYYEVQSEYHEANGNRREAARALAAAIEWAKPRRELRVVVDMAKTLLEGDYPDGPWLQLATQEMRRYHSFRRFEAESYFIGLSECLSARDRAKDPWNAVATNQSLQRPKSD
jgi:hypothetical protein